jgi:hypothetical protein
MSEDERRFCLFSLPSQKTATMLVVFEFTLRPEVPSTLDITSLALGHLTPSRLHGIAADKQDALARLEAEGLTIVTSPEACARLCPDAAFYGVSPPSEAGSAASFWSWAPQPVRRAVVVFRTAAPAVPPPRPRQATSSAATPALPLSSPTFFDELGAAIAKRCNVREQ